jgi:hypothetical protein
MDGARFELEEQVRSFGDCVIHSKTETVSVEFGAAIAALGIDCPLQVEVLLSRRRCTLFGLGGAFQSSMVHSAVPNCGAPQFHFAFHHRTLCVRGRSLASMILPFDSPE